MTFSTKKMIIAVIIVGILFILFLGYSFNRIQKVEIDINVLEDASIDSKLNNIANCIIDKYDIAFVDDISLKDIGVDILLVDHENKSACIIKGQSNVAVDYDKLDKSIVYCNDYLVLSEGAKTLIVNCDEVLGNTAARAIVASYCYEYTNTSNLSPESVVHFQTVGQGETTSFYRYAMIESAKDTYFNNEKLDSFYYYYDQWTYYKGTNKYQEAINYDYYDGFKAYVMAKVLATIEDGFSIEKYVDSYKNQYEIYSKDNEFAVMGLMWCLLREKQGEPVIFEDEIRTDIYKMLLDGVPQGYVEENELRGDYSEKFAKHIGFITGIIEEYEDDISKINPISPIITTETYSATIKVKDNYYIYSDYYARDSENNLLEQEYIIVEISPYKMNFFAR